MNSESDARRDEIAQARKLKKKQVRAKRVRGLMRIALVALALVALASLVTLATFKDVSDFFETLFSVGEYPVTLSDSAPAQIDDMNLSFAVRASDEVVVVGNSGAVLQRIGTDYNVLGMSASKNKLVVYNVGGEEIGFYNRTRKIFDLETDEAIIHAATGGGDRIAALCEDSRYSASLTVWNADAEELFKWYCARNFPYRVVFDNDASHVAVLAVSLDTGRLTTVVTVLELSSREEISTVALPFTALEVYLSNAAFTAVGDTGAARVDKTGAVIVSYDYGGLPLLTYDGSWGKDIVVVLGDNATPTVNRAVILDPELNERCRIPLGEEVRDVCMHKGRLYVLFGRSITAYAVTGSVAKTYETHYNTVAMVIKDRVVEILPDTACLVR